MIESVLGFFVVEAKDRNAQLDDHVPQVLTQLYATATKLKCGFHFSFPDSTKLIIGQENSYTGYTDERLRMALSCA